MEGAWLAISNTWHPAVSCFVREVVGDVVILPGYKLQVICFDIHGDVYKLDNIGGGGRKTVPKS